MTEKTIKIAKINAARNDAQSRVAINEDVVKDYADALTAGETFPPVTVFQDGSTYWLADGFHRYAAHKKIGALEIQADVRQGKLMDALLYSYGANKDHGLRRTNADKRKAVEGMIRNFVDWSDNRIAKHVGVSVPFVGSVRRPEVATRQQENRQKSTDKNGDGCNPITPLPPVGSISEPDSDHRESSEDFGPSDEEIAVAKEQEKADQEAYDALIEVAQSDDKLAAALELVAKQAAEIAQFRAKVRMLDERINGLTNEKNKAIELAKSWKRKFEKLEGAAA